MYSELIRREAPGTVRDWRPGSFSPARAPSAPTVSQVENAYQEARREGHAAGREQGMAEARAEAEALRALLSGAARELRRFDESAGDELVSLAIEIARQLLRSAIEVRPELILAVVREAVDLMPQFSERALLVLNPADAGLVRERLGAQLEASGWRISEDPRLERGGCRIETAAADVDATLPSRWRQVIAGLGRDTAWLAPDAALDHGRRDREPS